MPNFYRFSSRFRLSLVAAALLCTCASTQHQPTAVKDVSFTRATASTADPADGTHEHRPPYERPPDSHVDPAVPRGRLLEGRYLSHIYGYAFDYWLYVPSQYNVGSPASIMVFQDGGKHYLGFDLKTHFEAAVVFDNLIARGEVPTTIGLFIDPTQNRNKEYDSMTDKYGRFVIDEIVRDVVTRHYNISRNPDDWAIAGFSSGGIAALTVAWHFPDRFHRVLTHNGSFAPIARVRLGEATGGDTYPALIRNTEKKPLRIMLLSGTKDLDLNDVGNWLLANQKMAEALSEKHYSFRFMSGEGGHYPPEQAVADFPNALRWLWKTAKP